MRRKAENAMRRFLSGVVFCAATWVGQSAPPAAVVNPDFEAVASVLDTSGTYFMVADAKRAMKMLDDRLTASLAQLEELEEDLPFDPKKLPDIVHEVVRAAGIDQFDDVGASEVDLGRGVARAKRFVRVTKPAGVFSLLGPGAGRLESARWIPEDAALAVAARFDFGRMLPLAREIASAIDSEKGPDFLDEAMRKMQAESDVDLDTVVGGLGDEFWMYLRFGDEVVVPMPRREGKGLRVPRPRFAFGVQTTDSRAFDAIVKEVEKDPDDDEQLGPVVDGWKTVILTKAENNLEVAPLWAQGEGWLVLCSSLAELESLVGRKGPGYDVAAKYPSLVDGIEGELASFAFVNEQLMRVATDLVNQAVVLAADDKEVETVFKVVKAVLEPMKETTGTASVRFNRKDGFLWVVEKPSGPGITRMLSGQGTLMIPVLAAIAVPNFLEAQIRSKVARTRSDMRSLATGLEAYFVDNDAYPPWTQDEDLLVRKPSKADEMAEGLKGPVPSFRLPGSPPRGSLTTPISYMTSFFPDVFAEGDGSQTFGYYSVTKDEKPGWILWSPGPDCKFDLDWTKYDPTGAQPSPELLSRYAYDPTNGTVSPGDIFRVRQ